jgi:uncharacterized protein (DUF1499 family)
MNIWYIVLALVALLPVPMVVKNNVVPKDIGVTDGRLAELPPSPNAVSSQTDDDTRRVEALPYVGTREESRERILAAADAYGRNRIIENRGEYLHIVFITPFMRFKDDVEFLFQDDEGRIQFRSASRIGYSDMGLNLRRYEELRRLNLGDEPPENRDQ